MQCRCVWNGARCPNSATQEDGMCDWCGTRRPDDLRDNPNAMFDEKGEYLVLGGAGEAHVDPKVTPDACWMPNSGRTLASQQHGILDYTLDPDCTRHDADGLVCEAHPDRPWTLETGESCCGAPGMPCQCARWPCGHVGSSCGGHPR